MVMRTGQHLPTESKGGRLCREGQTTAVMVSFVAFTEDIRVAVRPVFLEDQSDLLDRRAVFAYFVQIENGGVHEVQLLRRKWRITEGSQRVREVEGAGVVGEQPVIGPGESYTYNSFVVLEELEGSMEGTYLMQRADGERFRIAIPRFYLRALAN